MEKAQYFRQDSKPKLTKSIGMSIWKWEIRRRISNNRLGYVLLVLSILVLSIFWSSLLTYFIFVAVAILIIDFCDTLLTFHKQAKIEERFPAGHIVKYDENGVSYIFEGKEDPKYYWSDFVNIVESKVRGFFVLEDKRGNYHLFFKEKIEGNHFDFFKDFARERIKEYWR